MGAEFDVVIANARLRTSGERNSFIGIRDGRIASISSDAMEGDSVIDAEGNLVTESFVDPHLHLCKVYTLNMVGEDALRAYTTTGMEGAATAIELASAVKDRYEQSWIYENARQAVREGIRNGVTHLQAFADTDTKARLEAVKALLRVRDEFREVIEIKVVAFPQDGVVRDLGAADYVRQAIEMGADVVGGIPWIESGDKECRAHIAAMLDIAAEYNRPIAMLVDDAGDSALRTTEMLASAALERGFINRVVACHARAMSVYPDDYFSRLMDLLKSARMTFVTDPHTGSLCMKVFDLHREGIPVALGQDDISDAYYPYGQHNMLEVAFLASHILGASTRADMDNVLDMVTTRAAQVLRLPPHRLEPGRVANLVVLDGRDLGEVLTRHRAPRYVISRGRLVAVNSYESSLAEMVP
jgi:cytosine deaminase